MSIFLIYHHKTFLASEPFSLSFVFHGWVEVIWRHILRGKPGNFDPTLIFHGWVEVIWRHILRGKPGNFDPTLIFHGWVEVIWRHILRGKPGNFDPTPIFQVGLENRDVHLNKMWKHSAGNRGCNIRRQRSLFIYTHTALFRHHSRKSPSL
ncbi:hypothetical protein CHS0354_020510 [Potamilus streckersoni]|uniref:Uncharacterized protein n=1 Tax=Potamilus streckersoni TaxID=2493646 RepID=A0AAE0SZP0_9BIVA|nr:hypothetical protein CHS0354_020510 [Potamilus streckersoni]